MKNNERIIEELVWLAGSLSSLCFVVDDTSLYDCLECMHDHVTNLIDSLRENDRERK